MKFCVKFRVNQALPLNYDTHRRQIFLRNDNFCKGFVQLGILTKMILCITMLLLPPPPPPKKIYKPIEHIVVSCFLAGEETTQPSLTAAHLSFHMFDCKYDIHVHVT